MSVDDYLWGPPVPVTSAGVFTQPTIVQPHQHNWVRGAMLDNWIHGSEPVDVYDCACGGRRVVPRGGSVHDVSDLPRDPRGFPHTVLQDHGQIPVT